VEVTVGVIQRFIQLHPQLYPQLLEGGVSTKDPTDHIKQAITTNPTVGAVIQELPMDKMQDITDHIKKATTTNHLTAEVQPTAMEEAMLVGGAMARTMAEDTLLPATRATEVPNHRTKLLSHGQEVTIIHHSASIISRSATLNMSQQ
jgi:hypothetical protein